MLFDFITSEGFRSIDRDALEDREKAISEIVVDVEESSKEPAVPALSPVEKLEQSIKNLIKEAETTEPEDIQPVEAVTEDIPSVEPKQETAPAQEENTAGKPLDFNTNETHSFAEWLQLSRLKPIERPPAPVEETKPLDQKLSLIDRFIQASPKITPVKNDPSPRENLSRSAGESPGLMTETLARVYMEQKKYTKAIQAYEILILKYPEKSVFFANLISEIKDLQQNNK